MIKQIRYTINSIKLKVILLLKRISNLLVLCLTNLCFFLLACLPIFIIALSLYCIILLLLHFKVLDPKGVRDKKERIIALHKSRLTETDINFIEKMCIEKDAKAYNNEVGCWEEQIAILNGVIIKKNSKRID